jgi:hypothetical protein
MRHSTLEQNPLQDLKRKITNKELELPDALAKALPLLRGLVSDEKLMWLASELQGYPNGLEFFQSKGNEAALKEFPNYRIVTGKIWLLTPQGTLAELNNPMTNRDRVFLSAPVSWLEEALKDPNDTCIVDMSELTNYFAKGVGNVVCECPKEHLRGILSIFRQRFIQVLDEASQSN